MDPTPKQFRPILDELRKIREHLEQLRQSINAAEESREKNRDVKPFWVDQVLSEYQESVGDKKKEAKRQYRIQNSLRWATWLAFIAAAVYGYIAIRQWRETIYARHQAKDAIEAAVSSAATAEKTLRETHQNFVADERPYVWLYKIGTPVAVEGQLARWDFYFVNFGKTPAVGLLNKSEVVITDPVPEYKNDPTSQADNRVFAEIHRKGDRSGVLLPQFIGGVLDKIGPSESGTVEGRVRAFSHAPMTPHQIELFRTPQPLGTVALLIHFEYFDSFGNEYHGEACETWSSTYGFASPCDVHNVMRQKPPH